MTNEVNARQLLDSKGQVYFPFTHVTCVDGIPDDIADLDLGGVQDDVNRVQTQISNLQNMINNMVSDTGWVNISLASGIQPYNTSEPPQARLISVNGINFISLRGGIKGVTARQDVTVGTLSSTFSSKINTGLPYVQNTSVASGEPNYSRMRVNPNGTIVIERTSIASPTASQWYPIDCTFMI